MTSPYDPFAWFYQRYWATPFHQWQMPILEHLLLARVPAPAHVVDFCCGVGELAKHLCAAGYDVTGIDSSAEMLNAASGNAPRAVFLHSDATSAQIARPADAATCAFDSVNHLLEPKDLVLFFAAVHTALKPGGLFVFDINTGEAYGPHWDSSTCAVEPDHAFFLRGGFDPHTRIGSTRIAMFRLLGNCWKRSDVEVLQRPWEIDEIESALQRAGFSAIAHYRPKQDGHFGDGRVYFTCTR